MATGPDLLLIADVPPALQEALSRRFTVHRDPAACPEARAVVGSGMSRIDAEMIARLPKLEIIAIHGVGHDGIDLEAARARGIRVTITADVLTDDVADLAMALLLAAQRRVVVNDRLVRSGVWRVPLAQRVSGRCIGIFGMGAIGQAIARRAEPFAAEVLYTARTAKPDLPWRFVGDIEALARESDVLIIAASGGAGTERAVNARVLDLLGPAGVLINIARGSIVDEAALISALQEGRIAGAGLDVFAHEPDVPEALRAMEQVVLAPHQGSATVQARAAMAELVLANLEAHFAGQPLPTPLV